MPVKDYKELTLETKKQLDSSEVCLELNRKLREISTLRRQNRIREQQVKVSELKHIHGSYLGISRESGIPLKTVHGWCSIPKEITHKVTARAQL